VLKRWWSVEGTTGAAVADAGAARDARRRATSGLRRTVAVDTVIVGRRGGDATLAGYGVGVVVGGRRRRRDVSKVRRGRPSNVVCGGTTCLCTEQR